MTTQSIARASRLPFGNEQIAKRLEQAARVLEEQDANVYRVRAYRGQHRARASPPGE